MILSITTPGASILTDPTAAAKLAHEMNQYCAKLRDDDPKGYGLFASLPSLLDTENCLKEIRYAYDELHADGITLFSRYGNDNHYLGHPDFKPIWEELEKRKAVVLVHPTHSADKHFVNSHLPPPVFDFPHETGRAAVDMLINNVLVDYPSLKIILSHAGGTLPCLINRVALAMSTPPMAIGKSREEIIKEASSFYFDTALSAGAGPIKALFELAKPGHVLFGTDFPDCPNDGIVYFAQDLEKMLGLGVMSQQQLKSVCSEAALELFPRLKRYF